MQKALVEHIVLRRRPGVYFIAVPNGGDRHAAVAAKLKAEGVRSGAPDMVFCVGGRFLALELKRDRGTGSRTSDNQKEHHEEIWGSGGVVAVAYGLDEALKILLKWGVIK